MINKKLLSFDFGGKSIHLAEGTYRGSHIEISRLINEPAPSDAVIDGRIEDKNLLRMILIDILKKHRISTRNVVISIQGASIIMREAVLPVIPRPQLEHAVKYEMEQYLPSQAGSYITEYKIMEQFEEAGVRKYRLSLAAIPKEIAHDYFNLLGGLHLKPVSLDIHPNTVSKLFGKDTVINGTNSMADKSAAMIDFGYRTTSVYAFKRGLLEYSRLLAFGGKDLDTALAAYYDIRLDQAEQKKIMELDLSTPQREEGSELSIYQSVRSILTQWLAEIQKVLQFYNNKNPNNRVETVYLFGRGAGLKGFDQYLKSELSLKQVICINSLSSVKLVNSQDKSDVACFMNAIGAIKRL